MKANQTKRTMINEKEKELFEKFQAGSAQKLAQVIGSEARTEHVLEMNGNARKSTGKPLNKYLDMKLTDKETGEEVEINPGASASPYVYKYFVRLDDKPVVWDQIQDLDPMLRATKGVYMIKYTPRHSTDHRKGRPFKIGQDLIRWDVRVSGYKYWTKLCETVPEFGWLSRNSTLTEGLFRLAVLHPGMSLCFTIKWEEYEAKLQAQIHRKPSKKDQGPFCSRKTSLTEYKKIKDLPHENKTIQIRYFNDILKEVNEAERSLAVQEEIIAECGKGYDRSRKCPRDPVTGQFIKADHKEE